MAESEQRNGGLPPKISLKPKTEGQAEGPPASAVPETVADRKPEQPVLPKPVTQLRAEATAGKPVVQPPKEPATPVRPEPSKPTSDQADEAQPVAESEAPDNAAAPKRPVLRPVGTSGSSATIRRPVPIGIRRDAPNAASDPNAKKATSRITLPSSEKSTTGQIKTIKIAPRSATAKIDTDAPSDQTVAVTADPKRQTSRISLESVLSGQGDDPSTIKIKRSPDGPTLRTPAETSPDTPSAPTEETAQASEEAKPESQKKTLKVKRPSVSTNAKNERTEGTAPMFTPPVATTPVREQAPHWIFSLTTLAAILVSAVLIYVLAAQALEPDLVEQPQPEAGLPWPGRISQ